LGLNRSSPPETSDGGHIRSPHELLIWEERAGLLLLFDSLDDSSSSFSLFWKFYSKEQRLYAESL